MSMKTAFQTPPGPVEGASPKPAPGFSPKTPNLDETMNTNRISTPLNARLAGAIAALALFLPSAWAQTGPSITTPPASQTNLAGANATLSVAVAGTGPFNYQWRFNGTNLPAIITTVAGGGRNSPLGGGAATNASLLLSTFVNGLAADASGDLFIGNSPFTSNNSGHIWKVDVNGNISTMAGNGPHGYSGDGGPATNASLSPPAGLAVDASGNLFIADRGNLRVRKVDANGVITTMAGKGIRGYSGDGGAATNASLNDPVDVAVDAAGNLFIADYFNNRVRKVGVNGIITTVAGNGLSGYSGDGGAAASASLNNPDGVAVDASGNLFIADSGNNRIRKVGVNGLISTMAGNGVSGYSGDGGAATKANLAAPVGVAVDVFGNLLIVDQSNGRIRKVDDKGVITTVAGGGSNGPGDGGPATGASLYNPSGAAVDASGNLFIADTQNNRIRKVALAGIPTLTLDNVSALTAGDYQVIIASPYGSVTSAVATLTVRVPPSIATQPASFAVKVGGAATFSVAAIGTQPLSYAWYFNGANLVQAGTNSTLSLANVSLTAAGGYAVVVTNPFGSVTSIVATLSVGVAPTIANEPASQTAVAGSHVALNVAAAGAGPFSYQWKLNGTNLPNLITTVAGDGYVDLGGPAGYSGDGGPATNAMLDLAGGWVFSIPRVAVDASGNLFIADGGNNVIRKVDAQGVITTVAGNYYLGGATYTGEGGAAIGASLSFPSGVAVDGSGNLFIADSLNNGIRKVDLNGIITTVAGNGSSGYSGDGGAAISATLNDPQDVAVDASGNLFIADSGNNRIRKVGVNGIITTVAGGGTNVLGDGGAATNASLYNPSGLAVDASGNLLFADVYNNRIRKVGLNGIITTVAGNGHVNPSTLEGSYSGDGGEATNAGLNRPTGLAVDASGNLFIADSGNNRIRKVDAAGLITTVAGNGGVMTNQYGYVVGLYSGDGGAATNAGLNGSTGLAVDATGNLFIADSGNNRIRKVGLNGIITTVAGNGNLIPTQSYGPEAGYYFGDGGAATNAVLNLPVGVAVDASGNLFIAESGNNRIRKVDANGVITTMAGNGAVTIIQDYGLAGSYSGDGGEATNAGLFNPSGVAVDASGNLFIADDLNFRIRKVDVNGLITTVAGNGPYGYAPYDMGVGGPYGFFSGDGGAATNASLNYSYGVAVDASGNLFIADSGNSRIREVATGGILPQLSLKQVSASIAGDYQVIIINPYGSVTSAVASLTVLLPPTSQIPGMVTGVPLLLANNVILGFTLSQTSSAAITVLQAPAITGPWTTNTGAVLTRNAQTGGYQFSVPVHGSTEFYQLRSP
jgi:sugar lactone lactonase YvrE